MIYSNELEWPRRSLRSTIWRMLRNFAFMIYYQERVPFISYNPLWLGLLMISQNRNSTVMQFIFSNYVPQVLGCPGLLMISQNSKSTLRNQKESTQSYSLFCEIKSRVPKIPILLMFSLFRFFRCFRKIVPPWLEPIFLFEYYFKDSTEIFLFFCESTFFEGVSL